MKPNFYPGKNIAVKVPAHEYSAMIDFYQNVLGLETVAATSPDRFESMTFHFGDKNLWIDRVESISQAEVWLEIETDSADEAKEYLESKGCVIRNEIEPLPSTFRGFWLSSPSNTIHLIVE